MAGGGRYASPTGNASKTNSAHSVLCWTDRYSFAADSTGTQLRPFRNPNKDREA